MIENWRKHMQGARLFLSMTLSHNLLLATSYKALWRTSGRHERFIEIYKKELKGFRLHSGFKAKQI